MTTPPENPAPPVAPVAVLAPSATVPPPSAPAPGDTLVDFDLQPARRTPAPKPDTSKADAIMAAGSALGRHRANLRKG